MKSGSRGSIEFGTKTPPATQDASRVPPTMKSTVNMDATRSKTAVADKTIGPRTA